MPLDRFSSEVCEELKYYVYKLIDPRTGKVFYVGKGKGNRVFSHVKNAEAELNLDDADDAREDLKLELIQEMLNEKFSPIHIIHRYGLTEDVAIEVEACLIDELLTLTNKQGGYQSDERGPSNAEQIIQKYQLEELKEEDIIDKIIVIRINKSLEEGKSLYDAVRYAWRMDKKRAQKAKYVIATVKGISKGIFFVDKWLDANSEEQPDNFPGFAKREGSRIGFNGGAVEDKDISKRYLNKRLPYKKGQANPIQYYNI